MNITKEDLAIYINKNCHTCLLAKDKRHIHRESINPKTYEILERIHSDLGGPLPRTYDFYKYYITFLDKRSRYIWVKLLKTKGEAYIAFETLKRTIRIYQDAAVFGNPLVRV